jgi:type VI secretion system protein ImpK
MPTERNPCMTLFSDFFVLGVSLRGLNNCGDPVALRSQLLTMFAEADRRADTFGVATEVMQQAKYALAAFLDEMIMSSRWSEKQQWASRLLQYELFQTQAAGVEFFDHLDAIRRRLPLNIDLLEVYYVCLLLGFQGRYKLGGREKLVALMADVRRDLQVKQGEFLPFSPHGKRPDDIRQKRQESMLPVAISVGCAGVALLIYIVLAIMQSVDANDVANKLSARAKQAAEGVR